MLYISVDNDHHTSLALLLIAKNRWSKDDLLFIAHQSPRNRIVETCGYDLEKIDVHPLCNGLSFKNPASYFKSWLHQSRLRRNFEFKPDDVLLVMTEYEINNALLARQMRRACGRVYLFDEGIGFYFNNSTFHELRTSLTDKLFLLAYNAAFSLLAIPAYAKKGFEGRMYVRIRDKYLDGIFSRMRLPIDRPVTIHGYRNFLSSMRANLPKNEDIAIFFANNLGPFGLKAEELALSERALRQMASNFATVHLKIHPADWVARNDIYDFYEKITNEYTNIQLVENSISGNEAIERIRPAVVVGTMGATMFDAFFFGCQPIFLFHLLPPVEEFGVCEFVLKKLSYRYIEDLSQLAADYKSGVDISSLLYEDEAVWPIAVTTSLADSPPQGQTVQVTDVT